MISTPLVTAIVPAYNAASTIDETLNSVRSQTYRNLQIVVVDDGSTDETTAVVEAHASADCRVSLIRQPNAGPAASRNRGVAHAEGEYVAPIDADDLWRPTKIEKQMSLMLSGGGHVGLVYTWQAIIDRASRILSCRPGPDAEGNVLPQLLYRNFVGSGSPALMRRQAIVESGGYDGSVWGCEDWKLYLGIASRYKFSVVKEHLTGYRQHTSSISSNHLVMLRSHGRVCSTFRESHAEHARIIEAGRIRYTSAKLAAAVLTGNLAGAIAVGKPLIAADPIIALRVLSRLPMMIAQSHVGKRSAREMYLP